MGTPVDHLPSPSFGASLLPAADRISLIGLSDPEIQAWTLARADEYRKLALTLLTLRNTTAPIHRLPNEILSNVFRFSWHGRNSLRIGHICSHWRSVLLATSEFWVDAFEYKSPMRVGMHLDHLAAILDRSGCRPIRPTFLRCPPSLHIILSPHMWRITSLNVTIARSKDLQALYDMLRGGMHALQQLVIVEEKEYLEMHDELSDLLDQEAFKDPPIFPALRIFDGPGVYFTLIACPTLQKVRLQGGGNLDSIHVYLAYDEFFQAWNQCPKIEEMDLENVLQGVWTSESADDRDRSIINPTSLRRLRINDYPALILEVLKYITPLPGTFELMDLSDSRNDNLYSRLFPDNISHLEGVFSPIDKVSIDSVGCRIRGYGVDGAERLLLEWDWLTEELIYILSAASITRLILLEFNESIDIKFEVLHKTLPHLTYLAIDSQRPEDVIENILPCLQGGTRKEDLVFPSLDHLTLSFSILGNANLEVTAWWKWETLQHDGFTPEVRAVNGLTNRQVLHTLFSLVETTLAHRASLGSRLKSLHLCKRGSMEFDEFTTPPPYVSESGTASMIRAVLEPLIPLVDVDIVLANFLFNCCPTSSVPLAHAQS